MTVTERSMTGHATRGMCLSVRFRLFVLCGVVSRVWRCVVLCCAVLCCVVWCGVVCGVTVFCALDAYVCGERIAPHTCHPTLNPHTPLHAYTHAYSLPYICIYIQTFNTHVTHTHTYHTHYVDSLYEAVRTEAAECAQKRAEYFQLAARARAAGQGAVAAVHVEQARKWGQKMKAAHFRAAGRIFAVRYAVCFVLCAVRCVLCAVCRLCAALSM